MGVKLGVWRQCTIGIKCTLMIVDTDVQLYVDFPPVNVYNIAYRLYTT